MKDFEKIRKEAEKYKELNTHELKKIIKGYKSLSNSASPKFYFIFTFICVIVPYVVFCKITILTFLMILLFHYSFMWKYLFEYKKFGLVSEEDKEEIDEVIDILESYLKDKENKKPL